MAAEVKIAWLEGEQAAFAGKPGKLSGAAEERAFELLLGELDKKQPLRVGDVARLGNEKLAELADELEPATCDVATMKLLLGRLGDDFTARAVSLASTRPDALLDGALPIEAPELAHVAAKLLFEHSAETAAESWLLRHASFAASVLAPLARNELRDANGCALAFLAAHGQVSSSPAWLEPIAALAPLVARDPSLALLAARGRTEAVIAKVGDEPAARNYVATVHRETTARAAQLPAFFDVASSPKPVLKDGGALSDDDVRAIGALLQSSTLAHPHAELAKWRHRCERDSLDAFATALLDAWCDANDPTCTWPLEACGIIGGDETSREIAKHVRAWSRARGWRHDEYAKIGCNVLAVQAQHGSEIARLLLDELGRAGGRVRDEAKRLAGVVDVTSQEEAKVPTLGLEPDGTFAFELGGETYRVVFDEGLGPHVTDASGARLAAFPRLRKDMDAQAWQTAKARYAGMVKDAKTIARHEIAVLERAMCDREAMPLAAFRERFVEHPLLRHLGARLVWSSGKTFRVSEDGSFADASDAALVLAEGAEVSLAHPALMSESERRAWIDRFADYEIVQPFPQLARETFVASADSTLANLAEKKTSRGRIFQLTSRGWALKYDRLERDLPGGATARIHFAGPVGAWSDEYTIASAACTDPLTSLEAVAFSELMRDAEYLVAR